MTHPMAPAPDPVRGPIPRPRTWFQRNWVWFLPVGCLGMLVGLGVFIAVIVGIVSVSMKSSDVYRDAMARAAGDPAVRGELGSPLRAGLFVSGSVQVSGPSGEADIAIPVAGPRNDGTLYAVATKSAGRWTFTTLELEVDGRAARIPLLPPAASP